MTSGHVLLTAAATAAVAAVAATSALIFALAARLRTAEAEVVRLVAAAVVANVAATDLGKRLAHLSASLSRSQQNDRIAIETPPHPSALVSTPGWSRCMDACNAATRGYAGMHTKSARSNHPIEKLLVSSFSDSASHSADKVAVDSLLAAHAARELPSLAADLITDPSLLLLLLDAPTCGTTAALLTALPGLTRVAGQICIPQADPSHYAAMVNRASAEPSAIPPHLAGPPLVVCVPSPGERVLLNVRCQRLDQWLVSNRRLGLRVPLFFADFESSILGKPKLGFSPLLDVIRFLRWGYAAPRCLLGVTVSFRQASSHTCQRHPAAGAPPPPDAPTPILTLDDLVEFVRVEAAAQGFACHVLDTRRYGMTFVLFRLTSVTCR
mgnify:CR=1 FL=1